MHHHYYCSTSTGHAYHAQGVVRQMVSAADKPAEADFFLRKNTVLWLISQSDKFEV
jgi:hypothetical protein